MWQAVSFLKIVYFFLNPTFYLIFPIASSQASPMSSSAQSSSANSTSSTLTPTPNQTSPWQKSPKTPPPAPVVQQPTKRKEPEKRQSQSQPSKQTKQDNQKNVLAEYRRKKALRILKLFFYYCIGSKVLVITEKKVFRIFIISNPLKGTSRGWKSTSSRVRASSPWGSRTRTSR